MDYSVITARTLKKNFIKLFRRAQKTATYSLGYINIREK